AGVTRDVVNPSTANQYRVSGDRPVTSDSKYPSESTDPVDPFVVCDQRDVPTLMRADDSPDTFARTLNDDDDLAPTMVCATVGSAAFADSIHTSTMVSVSVLFASSGHWSPPARTCHGSGVCAPSMYPGPVMTVSRAPH